MNGTSATDMLRSLSPDDIRSRLKEVEAEQRALRTLLRATIRMARAPGKQVEDKAGER